MHVRCTSCGRLIRAADMNLAAMAAKCRACDSLLDLREVLPRNGAASGATQCLERPPVTHAPGVIVDQSLESLRMTIPWFSWDVVLLVVFCIVMVGSIVTALAITLAAGMVTMLMFLVLPLLVGALFTYYVLCSLLNRTLMQVEHGTLTVTHDPLPWPGRREFPTRDLSQVFVRENFRQRNRDRRPYHDVCALLQDGRIIVLLPLIEDVRKALFIEQTLERHLRIDDRHVPGEIAR